MLPENHISLVHPISPSVKAGKDTIRFVCSRIECISATVQSFGGGGDVGLAGSGGRDGGWRRRAAAAGRNELIPPPALSKALTPV